MSHPPKKPPHPATVVQPRAAPRFAASPLPPHPATIIQRKPQRPSIQSPIAPPHAATQARGPAPKRVHDAPPHDAPAPPGEPVAQPILYVAGAAGALAGLYGTYRLGRRLYRWYKGELDWADLFADPPGYLGHRELQGTVQSNMTGQVNGTARITTVYDYQCAGTHTNIRCTDPYIFVDAYPVTSANSTSRSLVYVPWSQNEAHRIQLDGTVDVYMTALLNGCGILVSGTRQNPTVIHANFYDVGDNDTAEQRNQDRETKYNALANALNMHNFYLFSPVDYYGQGYKARFFGLRQSDGWRFYATYCRAAGKTSWTAQVWP